MLNPQEFIDDFLALGHSYDEAVAMAREELALRRRTAEQSGNEVQRRRDAGIEPAPIVFGRSSRSRKAPPKDGTA